MLSYRTKVTKLKKIKGKLRQVITSTDVFEADTVIVAAGLDSRPILATVNIDIPMQSVMLEGLVTEAQAPMFNQMLGTAEADFYGHQTKHGSFVFGGTLVWKDSQRITARRFPTVLQLPVPAAESSNISRP